VRHLFEQYRQKDVDALQQLPPQFWKLDPIEYLGVSDWSSLETSNLSFGEIHRLSSLLAGMSTEEPFGPDRLQRALRHLIASDNIKFEWAEQGRAKDRPISDDKTSKLRKTATKHEKRLLGGVIEPDKIKTTFNDVHAPIETIEALKTLTTLSLIRPEAFLYGVLATDKIPGLLLYGPPGTGKTLLAKAVAKESGAAMLEVSAAEINDMYVGEGEKNVKALFSLAKKLSPCVVFIDEADALFSSRTGGHQRVSHRELLNQFLKEWDGMSNDSAGAFIMVATNRPGDLDEAVLRRLPRRLLVDLPTENDRLEILKIHLRDEQLAEDVDLSDLAKKTPFYSGSDLKNLSVAAALNCVREENDLAKAHTGEHPYEHPEKRTLTAQHFSRALEEITASISEDMNSLKDIKKFDEQYGDNRGKKKVSKWGFKAANEAGKVLDTVKVRT
jgi:SpoVK/Ycf46/Vps4 family AAA+-type ATPase